MFQVVGALLAGGNNWSLPHLKRGSFINKGGRREERESVTIRGEKPEDP